MKRKRVDEILLPYKEDVPLHPSVNIGDKIIRAIELMVDNELKCIAVVKNSKPIGMVCLDDAFRTIGLQGMPH
ncbi:MAG: CBS domain-containing protein [Desulfobacterales bacterium]|nr:CBS domain-containing protein [Desulfobacterales bacterium]